MTFSFVQALSLPLSLVFFSFLPPPERLMPFAFVMVSAEQPGALRFPRWCGSVMLISTWQLRVSVVWITLLQRYQPAVAGAGLAIVRTL